VLWPAIPTGSPCGSSAQASADIASRGSARRCGLIGTGRGMLLAAGAPPSRDGCTVLFPAAQPTSNSMTRRCVSLASIIGPRTAAIRRAAGGPGTLVHTSAGRLLPLCGARHLVVHQVEAGPRGQPPQTAPPVGQARRLARRPRPLQRLRNVPNPLESNARRTADCISARPAPGSPSPRTSRNLRTPTATGGPGQAPHLPWA
jgi:hypothetical protein